MPLLVLNEPSKAQVLRDEASDAPRREALAVVLDRRANRTFEGIVDVSSRSVTSWRELPGTQPSLTLTEFVEVPDVVRADARWQEALRRRGITDLDRVHLDGPQNSVVETEVRPVTSAAGEAGDNAFEVQRTLLSSEKDARRVHDATTHRRWRVFNPGAPTPLGHLPGYVVLPRDSSVVPPAPSASVRQRAGFVDHHLWVTRHAPGELYAAGDHPNQSPDHDVGVVRYAADDQPIIDQDVVLWYTFGVTHAPRVEEWPVMNAQRTGFRLVPDGFFTRNPALDVPPPR